MDGRDILLQRLFLLRLPPWEKAIQNERKYLKFNRLFALIFLFSDLERFKKYINTDVSKRKILLTALRGFIGAKAV